MATSYVDTPRYIDSIDIGTDESWGGGDIKYFSTSFFQGYTNSDNNCTITKFEVSDAPQNHRGVRKI